MMRYFFLMSLLCSCTPLFFQPQSELLRTPTQLKLAYENVYFLTEDRLRLHGWWLPAKNETKGTVLFLHGNAENISTHIGSVMWLPDEGFNVFLFDYRGYGLSQGEADLAGLHQDIEAALTTVKQRIGRAKLIVFGQSLGGSLAVTHLAASNQRTEVCLLIIDSAFASYRQLVREKSAHFWLTWALQWPLSLTISGVYQPITDIARLSPLPILIIHGTDDKIILPHHAQQLYSAAQEPKKLWLIPKRQHIQMFKPAQKWFLLEYIEQICG